MVCGTISELNRDRLSDPDRVKPGQVLKLPADQSGSRFRVLGSGFCPERADRDPGPARRRPARLIRV